MTSAPPGRHLAGLRRLLDVHLGRILELVRVIDDLVLNILIIDAAGIFIPGLIVLVINDLKDLFLDTLDCVGLSLLVASLVVAQADHEWLQILQLVHDRVVFA